MKKETSSHTHGFTLIELLTVIAVIGILAAILIPITSRVRESARASQCRTNLRQISVATLLAMQDNRSRFPAMRSFEWDQRGWNDKNSPQYLYLGEALKSYIPYAARGAQYHSTYRCPTQESRGVAGGKGDFLVADKLWPHYRYNAFWAANNPMARDPARAMLFHETIWEDWPATDWPHQQGGASMSVSYADGHVVRMEEPAYRQLLVNDQFARFGWQD